MTHVHFSNQFSDTNIGREHQKALRRRRFLRRMEAKLRFKRVLFGYDHEQRRVHHQIARFR